jgi:site-specific DNA recombinase
MSRKKGQQSATPAVRCAIYTRKSTEEGLEQEFNSLDAQREAGEAYIKSQQHEGWICLPNQYDDGGFTGANMDRPALRRLLADIEAGKIDCVVVYKVDRLSRSLLDFGRIIETFDRHTVSFVSVTQAFNTANSMGRLILNVLLSFAQFEREMISERTRDKIAAARRKGKWSGGMPVLGYVVAQTRLVVDELEAERVREMFELYLEYQSLLAVVKELNSRGWRTKSWTTKKGDLRGGRPFDKNSLYQLLTNVAYVGKVKYKDEVHDGEHQPIVDVGVFNRVQALLQRNGRSGGRAVRNKHGALLRGLLRCASCQCGMSHTYSMKGNRQYRYYVCTRAQKQGWQACPSPSVPAGEIERFVVDQIRCIGRDPVLVGATLAETRREAEETILGLEGERAAIERQRRDDEAELRRLFGAPAGERQTARLADAQDRIAAAERRTAEIDSELAALKDATIDDAEVTAALTEFDGVWDALSPREKARVLELLIDRVTYDGREGNVAITFRPTGIRALMSEIGDVEEFAA